MFGYRHHQPLFRFSNYLNSLDIQGFRRECVLLFPVQFNRVGCCIFRSTNFHKIIRFWCLDFFRSRSWFSICVHFVSMWYMRHICFVLLPLGGGGFCCYRCIWFVWKRYSQLSSIYSVPFNSSMFNLFHSITTKMLVFSVGIALICFIWNATRTHKLMWPTDVLLITMYVGTECTDKINHNISIVVTFYIPIWTHVEQINSSKQKSIP